MSTIKADTLSNVAGTKSVTSADLADGHCTAWVNFNGTGTVAIRDSFNVSSITDNGVGKYSVNFATAMANSNYAPSLSSNLSLSAYNNTNRLVTVSTASLEVYIYESSSPTLTDVSVVSVNVFGGK